MPLYPLINNTSNQEIFRFWFPQRDLHDWRIWERVHYYYQGAGKPRQFADIWEQRMILRYVLQVKDNGTSKWIKSFVLKHHESKMSMYICYFPMKYLCNPSKMCNAAMVQVEWGGGWVRAWRRARQPRPRPWSWTRSQGPVPPQHPPRPLPSRPRPRCSHSRY